MNDQGLNQPRTVETLAADILSLPTAVGDQRNALTLWSCRLHLARNSDDYVELFIEGPRESFAHSPIGRGLEFGSFREVRADREFPALVIRSGPGEVWTRPMAHVSYEALQAIARNPGISNEGLVEAIGPYLGLVIERQLLSTEQQLGLTGELIFLFEVLKAASALGISSQTALSRWTGWDSASRDFKGGAVAVEVKTTGSIARHHWVHPLYQLLSEPGTNEHVFVYSVGLRVDRSRSYRLTTAIERILECLPNDATRVFLHQLSQYVGVGFNMGLWHQYELEPGFYVAQPPTLYRVDQLADIIRPESFVQADVPARVLDLRYRVELEGLPGVSQQAREVLLRELLGLGSEHK